MPGRQPQGWKANVEAALEGTHPRLGHSVVWLLQALIIISVLSVGIDTVPGLPDWVHTVLWVEEPIIVAVFTVEYLLRIAIAPHPFAYMRSFWGVVDLLAILPFYLAPGLDLRSARALRLLRLFRLLKLARYSHAAERISNALKLVGEELVVFGFVALIVLYVCAAGIYYFEHDAQPKAFASVFHAMWWAAVTLTTVGYGDVYPITAGGRIFTVFVLIIALGVVALPTGLIASALNRVREEERRQREEEKRKEQAAAARRKARSKT